MQTIHEQADCLVIHALTGMDLTKVANTADYRSSPAATVLAGCRAVMAQDKDKLQDIMKVACEYRTEKAILNFTKKYAAYVDKQERDEYAFTHHGQQFLPIKTVEMAKQSAAQFDKDYMKFPYEWREKIASRLPDSTITVKAYTKLADLHFDPEYSAFAIADRALKVNDLTSKRIYFGLSKAAAISSTNEQRLKIAHTIEKLDRMNGLYPYDNKGVNTPIQDMFGAPQRDKLVKIAGSTYAIKKLMELDPKDYEAALGKDVAEQLKTDGKIDQNKIETIIHTLPRSDKAVLVKYLKNAKIEDL